MRRAMRIHAGFRREWIARATIRADIGPEIGPGLRPLFRPVVRPDVLIDVLFGLGLGPRRKRHPRRAGLRLRGGGIERFERAAGADLRPGPQRIGKPLQLRYNNAERENDQATGGRGHAGHDQRIADTELIVRNTKSNRRDADDKRHRANAV